MKFKNILFFLIFGVILFIPLLDLLHPGFAVTHDGQDHIARIANFYQNLSDGVWIPRWAPNLNWGYGHPILEFLYPLPSYLASLFHFLGLSFIDSTKIVFALGMFVSGITMYAWLSRFWTRQASLVGSLLYVFAPYRFVELYVRGDIGENLAFVFIPLVLLFIHLLSKQVKVQYVIFGGLSLGGLILAHNAISLMALPFILLYIGYKAIFYSKNVKQFLLANIFLLICGFGISSFFWIPGLLEGKFTLRNIVTKGAYLTRFVTVSQLFYGPWNYGGSGSFTIQLGIMQWVSFIISMLAIPFFWIKKKKQLPFTILLVTFTLGCIYVMLPMSHWIWAKIILLQNFQFPWRFLALIVFTTAVMGALIIQLLPKKVTTFITVVVVGSILFLSKEYWHANQYKTIPESFFAGIYNSTTDTGESGPIWSIRFMEKRPQAQLEVISGESTVQAVKRTSTYHAYTIVASKPTQLVENTLYFPGWAIFVDGQQTSVEFQNQQHRGLMTFTVDKGKHIVEVKFRETKLRMIADGISLISIVLMLGSYIRFRKKIL